MLSVKYRSIDWHWPPGPLSNSWRGSDAAPPIRSPVVNTHPQVAPCGGNTPKDGQFFDKIKLIRTSYFQRISFLIVCRPSKVLISQCDEDEMRILSSCDAKIEAGLWPRPPPLSSLRTIYIYLCVFTPGNIQTRVYLGYWIWAPRPLLDTFFKKICRETWSECFWKKNYITLGIKINFVL